MAQYSIKKLLTEEKLFLKKSLKLISENSP